jgi:hypothetical protein
MTRIPDPRQPNKREHRWESLWLLVLLGVACRCENILAIAQWLEAQRDWLLGKVKIRAINGDGSLPKQASLYRFLWYLDEHSEELEAALHGWGKVVLAARGQTGPISISLDGKYLRGSRRVRKGERALLLLSAFVQELGLTLWQEEVSTSEDESAMRCVAELEGLAGISWLISGDAGITSAKVSNEVVAKKGATC